MIGWKVKGVPGKRPDLFCPKCDRCMWTKEDVRSRDERGLCGSCSEVTASKPDVEIVTIAIG